MWRLESTHPTTSVFSKCNIYWEYKNFGQSLANEEMRESSLNAYCLHIEMTMEERMEYDCRRTTSLTQPNDYLSFIIDGMDQNTTWDPKFMQFVKGIESCYLKTYLYRVLVHGIGLYCHVWILTYHRYICNQVVTSIMKVLLNVRRHCTKFPSYLRIQGNSCGRGNKNVYILALCVTLVALRIFKEVQLSFLLVGHIHETSIKGLAPYLQL